MVFRQRRPRNSGEWNRIVAYLPKDLAQRLKEKADEDQKSVSSYITALVAKDLKEWERKSNSSGA